jgi:hypothetical protein
MESYIKAKYNALSESGKLCVAVPLLTATVGVICTIKPFANMPVLARPVAVLALLKAMTTFDQFFELNGRNKWAKLYVDLGLGALYGAYLYLEK